MTVNQDSSAQGPGRGNRETQQFVTLTIGGQLFGVPVLAVQDVLAPQKITPVPTGLGRGGRRAQPARPNRHRDRRPPPT